MDGGFPVIMSNNWLRTLGVLLLVGAASAAHAQFKVHQSFTQSTAPGWTITNNALLTGGSLDPAAGGWLRLTTALNNQRGEALFNSGNFAGAQRLVVNFSYGSWDGDGAEGTTVFLFDSTKDLNGAKNGGGLGYCARAGAYLALGLDKYGNFI